MPLLITANMASKIIFVTGATRGIGLCIARALGQRGSGHTVLVAGRSKTSADKAVAELQKDMSRSSFVPIELDVTDDESIRAAVQRVEVEYGRLDGE